MLAPLASEAEKIRLPVVVSLTTKGMVNTESLGKLPSVPVRVEIRSVLKPALLL